MQRLGLHPSQRIPDEQKSCAIRGPAIQKARERAQFDVDNWHQMNWYINFVGLDLSNLSDGDLLNIQEEVIALSRILKNLTAPPLLTRAELEALQQQILNPLEEWLNKGSITLGPFSYTAWILRINPNFEKIPPTLKDKIQNLHLPEVAIHKSIPYTTGTKFFFTLFLAHLADLLGECGHLILRCPKCEKIFLQFRRHAEFCSRQCQSQRAAEVNRQKKKAEEAKAKPSQKNARDRLQKGGSRYGTIRRERSRSYTEEKPKGLVGAYTR